MKGFACRILISGHFTDISRYFSPVSVAAPALQPLVRITEGLLSVGQMRFSEKII